MQRTQCACLPLLDASGCEVTLQERSAAIRVTVESGSPPARGAFAKMAAVLDEPFFLVRVHPSSWLRHQNWSSPNRSEGPEMAQAKEEVPVDAPKLVVSDAPVAACTSLGGFREVDHCCVTVPRVP